MPYDNVPKEQWGKMDRCVEKVMAENSDLDKSRAIAICHTSIVGEEEKGGQGSGGHGHAGRPGQVGGSDSSRSGPQTPKKKPKKRGRPKKPPKKKLPEPGVVPEGSFEERMVDMIQNAVSARIIDTDHTSVLMEITNKKGETARAIFYPMEWQLVKKPFDDFEMEDWSKELKGGAGSGHAGHGGREGQVGGSTPGKRGPQDPKKPKKKKPVRGPGTDPKPGKYGADAMAGGRHLASAETLAKLWTQTFTDQGEKPQKFGASELAKIAGGESGILKWLKAEGKDENWDNAYDRLVTIGSKIEDEAGVSGPSLNDIADWVSNRFEVDLQQIMREQGFSTIAQARDWLEMQPEGKEYPAMIDDMIVKQINQQEVVIEVPENVYDRLLKALKLKEEPSQTVDGVRLVASEFAHVPDKNEPAGWTLPITDSKQIAMAITALQPSGFRGNPVQLQVPKSRVISRIAKAISELDDDEDKSRLMANLKSVKALDPSSFMVFKDLNDTWRWFGWVSNKWRDRDTIANPEKGGEILTDESHKEYVDWVDKAPDSRMPKLLAWHTMETAHEGRADWMDYADGFLMASGPLTAGEAKSILRVAEDFDLGMSHGFLALSKDPNEGLIHMYRAFENSFLPLEVAANPWTEFRSIMKEVEEMGLTQKKRGFLSKLMGESFVEEIEQETEAKASELQEAGVDFKEGEEPEAEAPEMSAEEIAEAEVVDLTEEEEAPESEAEEGEEKQAPKRPKKKKPFSLEGEEEDDDEEDEDDEDEDEEKELEPIDELRKELSEAMTFIGAEFKGIREDIDFLKSEQKDTDDMLEEVIEQTPTASLKDIIVQSVIGKKETRVDGRTSEAKDAPKETDAEAEDGALGIPFLNQIKARNVDFATGVKE